MDVYEVFRRSGHKQPFEHCGTVTAPDTEMAMLMAKECYLRRKEGHYLWVARRSDIHSWADEAVAEPAADKSYRFAHAYRDVVHKRDLARRRARHQ
ncbi:MAG: phenylacetic acid degradation protein PaaB [Actinobacteria bacterium]|nr:phenylacetic acid degradation protein PaaB [Actinomycetota bacterium]